MKEKMKRIYTQKFRTNDVEYERVKSFYHVGRLYLTILDHVIQLGLKLCVSFVEFLQLLEKFPQRFGQILN